MSSPLVSVIVPTYNRPEFLLSCLRSLREQRAHDFEVIVVNDGGIGVEEIVKTYGKPNATQYINHIKNKGLGAARNTGIKISRGKYILCLDDDDTFYPCHIFDLAIYLHNTQGARVAFTDSHRVHQKTNLGSRYFEAKREPICPVDFTPQKMFRGNFIPVCCVMFEKSILDEVGMFDEELESHEDWDLWVRMAAKGIHFHHIKKITCEISWRGDTMTSNASIMSSGRNKVFLRAKQYLDKM
jgi:O-antigen biosynthesis protein